jgi:branched-chain amino acid transport system substrate-binding protein
MLKIRRTLMLAAAAALFHAGGASAADPVVIGVVLPLSGPAAAYGLEGRQGAELAAEQINAAGGILGGRKLQLVFEDDKGSPQTGVAVTQKLMAATHATAIVSGMSSQVALAQSSITKNRTLFINMAAQADAITEQGNPWLFQINNTVTANARAFNKYLVGTTKPKTVAFVGENTEFAKPVLEQLKSTLAAANIPLVDASLYDADTRDFTSILTRIKSLDPDLLYVTDASPARAAQLWKQVRQIGGFPKEAMAPGLISPGLLKAAEGSLNGVVTGDIFDPAETSPEVKAFTNAVQGKFNSEASRIQLVGYEAVKVLASAMDKAKTTTDYDKVAQALRASDWATPRGALKFDDKGRAAAPYFYIQVVKGNKLTLVDRSRN